MVELLVGATLGPKGERVSLTLPYNYTFIRSVLPFSRPVCNPLGAGLHCYKATSSIKTAPVGPELHSGLSQENDHRADTASTPLALSSTPLGIQRGGLEMR